LFFNLIEILLRCVDELLHEVVVDQERNQGTCENAAHLSKFPESSSLKIILGKDDARKHDRIY